MHEKLKPLHAEQRPELREFPGTDRENRMSFACDIRTKIHLS